MPYDGSGNYVRVTDWTNDRDAGIKIMADRHDNQDDDFASALTNAITRDGQSQVTADISLNGHKLTNVAAPTNPQDAANKAYADSVRNFSTAATISGNDVQGRLKFTGTGTTGLEFATADIGFGARVGVADTSWHRFVFNTAADLTGSDVVTITDQGHLGVGLVPPLAAITGTIMAGGNIVTAEQQFCINAYLDTSGKWRRVTAGWAGLFLCAKTDGQVYIYRSSATGAADSEITWSQLAKWDTNGWAIFPSRVFSTANSFLDTNGNVAGSVWATWGANDAYTAISARIESRAKAYVDTYAATNARSAGYLGYNGSGGAGAYFENNGYFMSGVQKVSGDSYNMYFRSPQVYIAALGWVGFGW